MVEQYSLEAVLSAFEWLKEEKGVDMILEKVKEKIFWNTLTETNISKFKSFVRDFTSLYYLMKSKFSEVYRSTGERYFEHLREVVNNVLDLPHPNTEKVLIAIAHDSIEDTNKTFEWLNEDYGYSIALSVEAISKKPWEKYLVDIVNPSEQAKKQAKENRNHDYFSHLTSFESMAAYIHRIALSKDIHLTKKELREITQNSLDVKFADRIHNLSTQWDPNDLDQVRKKVDETKKYFLPVARVTNPEAYEKLKSLILQLEIRLHGTSGKVKLLFN